MTASANIKTPTMKLPLLEHVTSKGISYSIKCNATRAKFLRKDAAKFCVDNSRLTLASILNSVEVVEKVSSKV
jgi:hypothetical protein